MPITFTRCPTVEPGEAVTSRQLVGLSRAFNSRIRSGLGDPTFRIPFYLWTAARQIRNSDGGFLFPSQGEFFEQYQMLEPQDGEWPNSFAGTPEGVNVSTPFGAFVFGNESANIDAEVDRIETVAFSVNGGPPQSLADYWTLGQMQRGAIDPSTGAIASPALDAARLHMRIAYDVRAPYGTSYGGFQPIPEEGSPACASAGDWTPVNWIYKFTSLFDGSEVVFDGSCPEEPTHVGYILRLSDLYVVVLNNGETTYFRRSEWIEGPYTGGGSLRRDVGGQLDRALAVYSKDFRGTEEQRGRGWNREAFDFQAFLTRQYSLAPNRGTQVGSEITAEYPTFTWLTDQPDGTEYPTGHAFAEGYVMDAVYIRADNVADAVTVEMLDESGDVIATASATPVSGVAEAIVWLPTPATPAAVKPRLTAPLRFIGGSGRLTIQTTELYPYKPNASDAYLLLRIASAKTGTVHGSGLEEDAARAIWDGYRDYGCIVPGTGLPFEDAVINTNAVFDAFRRMSQHVRILSRNQLIGYAVEDGKSVLWFARENTVRADTFAGIAPVDGVGGIAHTAEPGGLTNEWMIGFQFKAYHPSESSIWKPSAYSDYYTFSDRCHFYHPPYTSDLQQHLDYGATLSFAPEGAPGYRYAKGYNIQTCDPLDTACVEAKIDRYKSCRIYEPDVEIDTAEELVESGVRVVKLTLKDRLHHSDDAVSSIDRDISTWDTAALRAEAYRSTENAIREYLLNQYDGTNAVAGKPGDSAVNSGVDSLTDNPFGTVFPTIFLTHLMPEPYIDGNDSQNAVDTPLLHDVLTQAELYLRAMCEGYVDGKTSEEYACASGISSWYDYTFPNLCFDAFQGQWIAALPSEPTRYTRERDTRADRPQGFGPFPNTLLSSEVWNQFATAINLLDKVRVMLPMKFEVESRSDTDSPYKSVGYVNSDPAAGDCASPGDGSYHVIATDQSAPSTVTVPRTGATTASGVHRAGISTSGGAFVCDGSQYVANRFRQEDDYWLDPVDPDATNAIPETWSAQFSTDAQMLFAVSETRETYRHTVVPTGSGSECGGTDAYETGAGTQWLVEKITETTNTCEILDANGTVPLPELGTVTVYAAAAGGGVCTEDALASRVIEPVTVDAFILTIPLEGFEE